MSNKFLKANIGLDKIERRRNKHSHCKEHSADEKQLVNACLKYEQLTKDIDRAWRMLYLQGYTAQNADSVKFAENLEFIAWAMNERDKVSNRIARLEKKTGKSEDIVMREYSRYR